MDHHSRQHLVVQRKLEQVVVQKDHWIMELGTLVVAVVPLLVMVAHPFVLELGPNRSFHLYEPPLSLNAKMTRWGFCNLTWDVSNEKACIVLVPPLSS